MKKLISITLTLALIFKLYGQSPDFDSFILSYVKDHNFNGTILIQQKGIIQYHKSFGYSNQQFKVPNSNETKYKIASITKLFTATLILKLYEQGKLDLNKTIRTYLPDYTGEGADKVTIHQLLNHTSGMANPDTVKSVESAVKNGPPPIYQKAMTTDEILKKYCSSDLIHEPGKVFDYNNAEYIILGKIIEHLYDKPFEQVLQEIILHPLRMRNSGMLNQYDIINGLADTYFFREDINLLVNDLPVYIQNWYASGAMYSTPDDLLTFSNALFNLKILKQSTLDLMFKPGLDDYGYSVWSFESELNGKKYRTIKRPGRIMGAGGDIYRLVDADLTIIILSNTATTDLDDFLIQMSKRLSN